MMASVEQRVSYIEGVIPSLATKADLAELRAELLKEMGKLETRLIKWIVVVQFLGLGAVAAIMRFLA